MEPAVAWLPSTPLPSHLRALAWEPVCATPSDGDCGEKYQGDHVCDDGGPGSEYYVCPLGEDCMDCGGAP